MKTRNSLIISALFLTILLSGCMKKDDDNQPNNSGLSAVSKDQYYKFSDSWGYLYSLDGKMFEAGGYDNDSMATYMDVSLIPTAFFLPTAASTKFSTIGAGTIQLNSKTVAVLSPGCYLGSTDIKGIPFNSKAVWSISGSSLVPAFTDSLNEFVTITGVKIPKWGTVSKENDLTITLIGNTSNADEVFLELEMKGTGYDSERYLSKKINPGSLTCTFTSADLKNIAASYPAGLGVTLRVYGYKYKKVEINSKAYYIVNETYLTHAIYWAK
jgi:hypothetical protein